MKRFELDFKRCASLIRIPKFAVIFMLLLALDLSGVSNIDAQRHGGGIRSGVIRGGSHVGVMPRDFGYRGHFYRGFYGNRTIPYWYYFYLPGWGDFFWDLPPYDWRFFYNGFNFYYNDGIYYKDYDGKYEIVAAPLGYKTKVVPKESFQFALDGVQYYYYYGSYYTPKDGKYEVVKAPLGAIVESIPQGYDKVVVDGQTYYTLDKVQYKAIMQNNEVWYQVIKSN